MFHEARLMEHDFVISRSERLYFCGPPHGPSENPVSGETEGGLPPHNVSSAVLTVVAGGHGITASRKLE